MRLSTHTGSIYMKLFHVRLVRLAALLFIATTVGGCAVAPGMRMFATTSETQDADEGGTSQQLQRITPELIRQMASQASDLAPQMAPLMGSVAPYKIGLGDLLTVQLPDHPDLQAALAPAAGGTGAADGFSPGGGILVRHDGTIQFPFIASLHVAGLTENQARDQLAQALSRYLRNPQVQLRVSSYRSQRIYIDGEVRNPGIIAIGDLPLTLPDALSRSGGISATGDTSNMVLTRNGKSYPINLPLLTQQGINPMDLLLQSRDVLRVASKEESKIFVIGEIQRPAALLMHQGRMTLNEAIGESNGLNPATSNAGQIYVVRTTAADDTQPMVYHLEARSPAALVLAEKFILKPRDVVFVDPVPLATWNRVINLILPGAAAVTTTSTIVNPSK
jgi:polysaccharide export outer membrane protein